MADTLRDLVIRLGFDVNTSAIPQVDEQLNKATRTAGTFDKAMGSAFARFAGPAALAGVAYKGIGMVTNALEAAGDASVEFGKQMASVQTLLPNQDSRVKQLGDDITTLAQKYGRSTADIAAGTYEVISAFGDTKDTMKSVEITLQGAIAGNTDLANAQQLVNATTEAYGDTSVKTQRHIMDMAAQMQNLGLGKIPEFASRMGMVTGSAKMMNVSMEELFGVVGRSAGVTGTTAESITQLHATLTALMNPTADMKKAFKTIFPAEGVKNIEELIGKKGLVNTLTLLADKTDHSAAALKKMFGPAEAVGFISQMTTTLKNETIAYTEANRTAYDVVAQGARSAAGGLNKTGTELAKLDEQFTAASKNMGARLAPMQIAFKQFSLGAIQSLSDVESAMEKLVAGKNEKPGEVSAMGLGQTVVQGLGFLGNVAGGIATDILPQALGGGAGFTSGANRTIQDARQLVDRLNGGNGLQEGAGAQRRNRIGEAPVALNAGGKAFRDVSTQINQTNTINLTLPEGADAQQFADAFDRAARKNADALARNVQSAASGDSP